VPGRDAVVVLSYDFWKNTLGSDPSILNNTVLINGIDFTVIGIAPEHFTGMDQFVRPAFYVPLMMASRLVVASENPLENRQNRFLDVKGRLKPGMTTQQAGEEMTMLWAELARQYPDANRTRVMTVRTELQQRIRTMTANAIISAMMTALAALVLMIACANVANLMLGRARARSREMAIRLALGVGRMRLLRQLLTENLLLAFLGGALGLGFAYGGIRFLAASAQELVPTDIPVAISPELDSRVLFVSLLAAVLSAALFGLAPAWQSLKTELVAGLKSSESGETMRRRTIGRNILVVAQVALSMVLLVATGMVQAGFRQTLATDPGFRTDHLITMALDTSFANQTTPDQSRNFYRNLVERARALPGVRSVALTDNLPLDRGFGSRRQVIPEGYVFPQGQETASLPAAIVDEKYFITMRTEILRGRPFTDMDRAGAALVAIVNEVFAATYWPGQEPVGKRLRLNNGQGPWVEVVGLARTEKYGNVLEPPMPFMYLPFAQQEKPQMSLLVETADADASPLAAPLRAIVRELDVNQPVFGLRTFSTVYEREGIGPQLLVLRTAAGMGILGLTISLVGLYGLVAYTVARRTREIGIRVAIGAGRTDVLMMVLRQGMILAIGGIVVGGIASAGVARLLMAGVTGLAVPNVATFVAVPILLVVLTLVASYIPARRASRIDPLRALRYE
jgi:predicted permease